MNPAVELVDNDLKNVKAWNNVKVCLNEKLQVSYLVAQETIDSLRTVILACNHKDVLSHFEIVSFYESVCPPGNISSYENGILLAIVGSSSNIVYHRLCPGMCNILPKKRER